MLSLRNFRNRASLFLAMCGALFLVYSTPARGQGIARDALASFPADTQQLAYTNLAELRNASDYAKLRGRLWGPQLRGFVEFLRDAGDDPEKDVDEVVLGWRTADTTGFFGLANGRFHPSQVREFFARRKLPTSQYAGSRLYSSGKEGSSGQPPPEPPSSASARSAFGSSILIRCFFLRLRRTGCSAQSISARTG